MDTPGGALAEPGSGEAIPGDETMERKDLVTFLRESAELADSDGVPEEGILLREAASLLEEDAQEKSQTEGYVDIIRRM